MISGKIEVGTCLIGCRKVGKTAFVNRLKDDQFHELMKETAMPQHLNILITSPIARYKLKIMDIPGNQVECNHIFIEDNPFLLLFFDLINLQETFRPILKYLQLINNNLRHDRTVILFGTKTDLIKNVQSRRAEPNAKEKIIDEIKAKHHFFKDIDQSLRFYRIDNYFEISSKTQSRAEFEVIVSSILDEIYKGKFEDIENNFSLVGHSLKKKLTLDVDLKKKSKKGCC